MTCSCVNFYNQTFKHQSKFRSERRQKGVLAEVFYIIYIITYGFGFFERGRSRQYYNANYVTYREKGSKEKTEGFEERKNWIFGAWN